MCAKWTRIRHTPLMVWSWGSRCWLACTLWSTQDCEGDCRQQAVLPLHATEQTSQCSEENVALRWAKSMVEELVIIRRLIEELEQCLERVAKISRRLWLVVGDIMPGEGWVDATSVRKLVISRPTVRLVQKRELLVDTRIPEARKACV